MSFGDSQFQKPITRNFTAVSQTLDITSPNQSTSVIQITGTWSGTLVVEGSNDNTNYTSILFFNSSTSLFQSSIVATNGTYFALTNGYQSVRIRASAWTSGTAITTVFGSDATSTQYNIDILRGATDGTLIGNLNNQLRTADILNAGTGVQGALTVGTSAVNVRVGGSNLTNRKLVTIHNNSLVTIYWGYSSGVTTSNGTPIFAGQQCGWAVGPSQDIFAIAGTAGNNTRVTEGA